MFPQIPQRVASVGNKIKALAVEGSVKTITDRYRREYNYILYWEFRATQHDAQELVKQLGSDVGARVPVSSLDCADKISRLMFSKLRRQWSKHKSAQHSMLPNAIQRLLSSLTRRMNY